MSGVGALGQGGVTGFATGGSGITAEEARDTVGAALTAGNNIDITVDDPNDTITVAVETLTLADISDVTASAAEVNVLDGIPATLTATELGHVDGVTSAIQTQLNAKAADADVVHDTGDETVAGVKTFTSDPIVPDEAYGAGWNGVLEPPTKNAVYDKIESVVAGGATTFADNVFRVQDNGDATKEIAFEASGITTGTVRTFTAPNLSGTLALTAGAQTFTDKTLTAPTIADFTNAAHDHADADDGGTLTLAALPDITASAAELNILDGATLTVTELNFVDGVTSAIQTQLNTKVDTANTPNANEYARFTDADTIEGRTEAEFKADFNLEIGTDVQAFDADLTTLATAFTTASASGAASLAFAEDTDNGTNRVLLQGPASTADVTVTLPASAGTLELTSHNHDATYQPLDADLTAIAALTTTAGGRGLLALADPDADRVLIWDDSAGAFVQAAVGTGLSVSATPTLDLDADLVTLATAFTTASASGAASLDFAEDTDNGTNRVRLQGAASTADVTVTLPASTGTLYVSGGTDVAIADGGTGQSTATAAFDALAPTTTQGDLIYHDGSDNIRLAKGTAFQHLRMNSGATAPEWAAETKAVNITIGDGTNEIPDGVWCDFDMPVAGTFIRWRLMATKFTSGSTGSIVLDIWGEDFASFPPTVADSISTSKPTISGAASAEDSSITDWTPEAFAAGDTFRINVDSCTTITLCTLSLWFTVP